MEQRATSSLTSSERGQSSETRLCCRAKGKRDYTRAWDARQGQNGWFNYQKDLQELLKGETDWGDPREYELTNAVTKQHQKRKEQSRMVGGKRSDGLRKT